MNKIPKKRLKLVFIALSLIIFVIIIGFGVNFGIMYFSNKDITGTWQLDDGGTAQYEFSIWGDYHYYEDSNNKKCDLWNCNYESGKYLLSTDAKTGEKIISSPDTSGFSDKIYQIFTKSGQTQLILKEKPNIFSNKIIAIEEEIEQPLNMSFTLETIKTFVKIK